MCVNRLLLSLLLLTPLTAPANRQAGLYQAIQDRKLDVQTIVQSWPVQDYGVKTVFTFQELEQAMTVK